MLPLVYLLQRLTYRHASSRLYHGRTQALSSSPANDKCNAECIAFQLIIQSLHQFLHFFLEQRQIKVRLMGHFFEFTLLVSAMTQEDESNFNLLDDKIQADNAPWSTLQKHVFSFSLP
ncbi:hypothetical protein O9993_10810 [Vibrio lentus]|nr:hypothetical protein [Vibrio lentus]